MQSQEKHDVPPKTTQALGGRNTGVTEFFSQVLWGFLVVQMEAKGIPGHGIVYAEAQKEENACRVQEIERKTLDGTKDG